MGDKNEEQSLIDKRFTEFQKAKDQQKLLMFPELLRFAPLYYKYVRARVEDFSGQGEKKAQSTSSVDDISSKIKPGFVDGIVFGNFNEDLLREPQENAQSTSSVDGISSKNVHLTPSADATSSIIFGNFSHDLTSEPQKNVQSTFTEDDINSNIAQLTFSVDGSSSKIVPGCVQGITFGSFNGDLSCEPRKYVQPTSSVESVSSNIDPDSIIFGDENIARIMKLQKEKKKAEELIDEEKRENGNI